MLPKRVYAEINLDNMIRNIENIKKKTATDVMAVIKADAYGHGAVHSAIALNEIGIRNFGVATADEALQLRHNKITGNILILGYTFAEDYKELIKNDVSLTVFDFATAETINSMAENLNIKAKIHIKIDTGMGRIGFVPSDISLKEIEKIAKLNSISIEGVFTHFACADMKDKTSAENQKKLFLDFTSKIEKFIHIPTKHMCNSAAIMDFDGDFLDMVRSGITTYGLLPSDEVCTEKLDISPVMSIKSHVAHIKTVKEGFAVSYGSTFVTDRKTVIATIPVGYGDGYPRSLSNSGKVIINGKFAPIIGRVCMDQFMVDVTDIDNVQRGAEVTLVGKCEDKTITVEELSSICGRFNYEFVCDINKRVPRVYIRHGEIIDTVNTLK